MKKQLRERDELFNEIIPERFRFDENVARFFDDMVLRSIPGYMDIALGTIDLCMPLTEKDRGLKIYDLGCATGTLSTMILSHLPGKHRFYAVDTSHAMLERCKANLASIQVDHDLHFVEKDIESVVIKDADVVLLNFTLQFLPIAKRLDLIKRIYAGLKKGGVFILSEKTRHPVASAQSVLESIYTKFKQHQGYSDLEISRKRKALEDVLVTESCEQHLCRLEEANFKNTFCWYYNRLFASFYTQK